MDKQKPIVKNKKQLKNRLISQIAVLILKKRDQEKRRLNGESNKDTGTTDLFTEPK